MMQYEFFEKDFQQERKDREHAHSLIADKDKELMQALYKIKKLQQQQSSSQKQTESWLPFRAFRTQPQMTAMQVAELQEAKATAVQQVKSYKTQADGYNKELKAERKRTRELKQELEAERERTSEVTKELESSKTKPTTNVGEKVRVCNTLNFSILICYKQRNLQLSRFSF